MSAIVYQESDFYIQNITTFSQYVLNLTGNLDDAKLITIMGEYHDAKFDCKSDKKSIMVDEYVIEQSKDCKTKAFSQLAFQISALAPYINPKTISPIRDKILIIVKTV